MPSRLLTSRAGRSRKESRNESGDSYATQTPPGSAIADREQGSRDRSLHFSIVVLPELRGACSSLRFEIGELFWTRYDVAETSILNGVSLGLIASRCHSICHSISETVPSLSANFSVRTPSPWSIVTNRFDSGSSMCVAFFCHGSALPSHAPPCALVPA